MLEPNLEGGYCCRFTIHVFTMAQDMVRTNARSILPVVVKNELNEHGLKSTLCGRIRIAQNSETVEVVNFLATTKLLIRACYMNIDYNYSHLHGAKS